MKTLKLPIAFIAILLAGCGKSDSIMQIKDPEISTAAMIQVIRKHTNRTESPALWNDIANSGKFDEDKRSIAIFQLFQRHFRPGMTLTELRSLWGSPAWLTERHVYLHLIGKGPSWPYDPNKTIAVLKPWIRPDVDGAPAIYMEIDGNINAEDMINYFRTGRDTNHVGALRIVRIESFEWTDPPRANELVNEWGLHVQAIRPSSKRKMHSGQSTP